MQFIEVALVVSAFVSGAAMPLFPNPYVREGSQKAIWTLAFALGAYVLFLSICAVLPNFPMLIGSSFAALAAGYLSGMFINAQSTAEKSRPEMPARTTKTPATSGRA